MFKMIKKIKQKIIFKITLKIIIKKMNWSYKHQMCFNNLNKSKNYKKTLKFKFKYFVRR